MEFIVKIGADQQGLNDTLQRITTQFKTMNTNMPASWLPQQSAVNQYGNIFKSSSDLSGLQKFTQGLSEINPGLGALAEKLSGVAGPIGLLSVACGGLALAVKGTIDQINEAYQLSRQSRITGASAGMLDNVKLAESISGVDFSGGLNFLNSKAGAFNAGDKDAVELFNEIGVNPSGQSVDAVLAQLKGKFAGINDPAKRARLSKGLFGKSGYETSEFLSNLDISNTAMFESADIETLAKVKKDVKNWWERFKDNVSDASREVLAVTFRGLGLGRGARRGEFTETIGEAEAAAVKAGKPFKLEQPELKTLYLWSDGSKRDRPEPKDKKSSSSIEDKTLMFQADSMAQAGLFTGSSLLLNPNFSIQQEQLAALQAIRSNTERIGEGTFS